MDGVFFYRTVNLVYVFSIIVKMDRIYGVKVVFIMLFGEFFFVVCVM